MKTLMFELLLSVSPMCVADSGFSALSDTGPCRILSVGLGAISSMVAYFHITAVPAVTASGVAVSGGAGVVSGLTSLGGVFGGGLSAGVATVAIVPAAVGITTYPQLIGHVPIWGIDHKNFFRDPRNYA